MVETKVLFDNKKMRLELQIADGFAKLCFSGVIDEDVNFSLILDKVAELGATLKMLQFDLGRIERMNSCGVREWLLLMERMPVSTPREFVNVAQVFVEQANMIPSMFGKKGTRVLSFQAPYQCSQCNQERSIEIRPHQVKYNQQTPIAPEYKCDTCGKKLDFDWLEDEYFSFLKRL